MEHCENLDEPRVAPINDAIRCSNELAKVRLLAFGHHASGIGEGLELIGGEIQARDDDLGVGGGVSPNEVADCCEIVGGLLSPADLGHNPRRRRTSSWLMVLPASAC